MRTTAPCRLASEGSDVVWVALRLWCTTATWPSNERIAEELQTGGGTIGVVDGDGIRERITQVEVEQLLRCYRTRREIGHLPSIALEAAAEERAVAWAALEECLVFVPLLASIAVRAHRNHQRACAVAIATVLARARAGSNRQGRGAAPSEHRPRRLPFPIASATAGLIPGQLS